MSKKYFSSGAIVQTKEGISPSRDFAGQVAEEYITGRRPAANGKVLGEVHGTCGEVLMVKHPHNSAVYFHDELEIKTFP